MHKDSTPPRVDGTPSAGQPEIDYTPKTYSLRDHIPILLKFVATAGAIFLAFWLYETM